MGIPRATALKWAGILAAVLSGGVLIANGHTMEGLGVISASFGSGSVLAQGN